MKFPKLPPLSPDNMPIYGLILLVAYFTFKAIF